MRVVLASIPPAPLRAPGRRATLRRWWTGRAARWGVAAAAVALLAAPAWPASAMERPVSSSAGLLTAGVGHGDTVEDFVQRVAVLVNEYRGRYRLAALAPTDGLIRLAESHSRAMAEAGRPSHAGFRDRFQAADSEICVENIAAFFDTPEALVEGWRRSPSHDRNLLEPRVVRMGLAARDRYVTFFACR